MALINRSETDTVQQALTAWLQRLVGLSNVSLSSISSPKSSGFSNEIFLFDARWQKDGHVVEKSMVARVEPVGARVFPTYDLTMQHRLMATLADRTPVPVPSMIGVETDQAVLGASFLVMERALGRAPSDDPPYTVAGWVTELSGEQRARLWANALGQLAAIHAVDWQGLGLEFVKLHIGGTPGAEQQLNHLRHLRRFVSEAPHATIDAAFEWMDAHRPTEEGPIVLSWGDARPGNMLFGDDLAVTAVLDWEMASLAPPEVDLGLWLFMQRHHTEGIGVPLPAGIPDHAATAERYATLTGYRPRDLEFYEALACLRGSILMIRYADLMTQAGLIPTDSPMRTNNPACQLLARMLGLPPPEGSSASWIGHR